jgi:hypothetical protein
MHQPKLQVFTVWEPVLPTDFRAPSTASLRRLHDPRVAQFWDRERLLSRALGERDRESIAWDHIAIYEPGKLWQDSPPSPAFEGGTVVSVIQTAKQELTKLLAVSNHP